MNNIKVIAFCILIVSLASCGPSKSVPFDELVDIGTHKLYIHCEGDGKPTIVIDTGVGETFESWESVIELLKSETRVCVYHRAGYGKSEIGPMPRDSQRVADELHKLLILSNENNSIILVGHSLGGLNMQLYANSYPEQVKGLVLIDPPPLAWMGGEGFPELRELFMENMLASREAADAASESNDPELMEMADFLNSVASENEEFFGQTAEQISEIHSFDKLPLTVIGASELEAGFGEFAYSFRQFWNQESIELSKKSSKGKFILAEGSSHHIHLDAPKIIVDAILEMIKKF